MSHRWFLGKNSLISEGEEECRSASVSKTSTWRKRLLCWHFVCVADIAVEVISERRTSHVSHCSLQHLSDASDAASISYQYIHEDKMLWEVLTLSRRSYHVKYAEHRDETSIFLTKEIKIKLNYWTLVL